MRRARAKVLTRKETHNIIFRASIRPSHRSANETAALIVADPVDVIVKRYVRLFEPGTRRSNGSMPLLHVTQRPHILRHRD